MIHATYTQSKPGKTSGNYERLFGEYGEILTRAASTVISSGLYLERSIKSRMRPLIDNDLFSECAKPGIYYVEPASVEGWGVPTTGKPDIIVVDTHATPTIYLVQLKSGNSFDTKKARAERDALTEYSHKISWQTKYLTRIIYCSFFAESRDEIVKGWKKQVTRNFVRTGKELCEMIGVDYYEVKDDFTEMRHRNIDAISYDLAMNDDIYNRIVKYRKLNHH